MRRRASSRRAFPMRSLVGRGAACPLALAALLSVVSACRSTSTNDGPPAPVAQAPAPSAAAPTPTPTPAAAVLPPEHHATDPLLAHELVEYETTPRALWGFLFKPPGNGP